MSPAELRSLPVPSFARRAVACVASDPYTNDASIQPVIWLICCLGVAPPVAGSKRERSNGMAPAAPTPSPGGIGIGSGSGAVVGGCVRLVSCASIWPKAQTMSLGPRVLGMGAVWAPSWLLSWRGFGRAAPAGLAAPSP